MSAPGAQQQIRLPQEQLQQWLKFQQEDDRLNDNLNKVSAQLDAELRARRSKYLTRKEIKQLSPEIPVYKSVGKAFILDTVPQTIEYLRSELGKSDQRVLNIKKAGIYILSQQEQVAMQVQELVKPFMKQQ